jgi:hypothetical protein
VRCPAVEEITNSSVNDYTHISQSLQRCSNERIHAVYIKVGITFLLFHVFLQFRQFANIRMEVMFWNPRWVPVIGKLLPRWVEDQLASRFGWHLWIYAQKQRLKLTKVNEVPHRMPSRAEVQVHSEASVA